MTKDRLGREREAKREATTLSLFDLSWKSERDLRCSRRDPTCG